MEELMKAEKGKGSALIGLKWASTTSAKKTFLFTVCSSMGSQHWV
jgi:hypothetical protein